jgi:hypothetical protein
MKEGRISEEEARATLEEPDLEYPGNLGRTLAERVFPGRRLLTKVVYNLRGEDERVVVTVERGADPQEVDPEETRVRSRVRCSLHPHPRG